jgi:dTDP-4-dehydrorhamnose 3,5-epimerase
MQLIDTPLEGSFLIDPWKKKDDRGFFSRLLCTDAFKENGLEDNFVQVNHSFSKTAGTLRGLHYQLPPFEETKVVKCVRGSIFDVIVDVRPYSKTFGKHFSARLDEENGLMMYVPKGFAHGFYSLEPNTEIIYFVSQFYAPEHERGIRWNDPMLSIEWPGKPAVLSEKDASHPNFKAETQTV